MIPYYDRTTNTERKLFIDRYCTLFVWSTVYVGVISHSGFCIASDQKAD